MLYASKLNNMVDKVQNSGPGIMQTMASYHFNDEKLMYHLFHVMHHMLDQHWDTITPEQRADIEMGIKILGSGPNEDVAITRYHKADHGRLKTKFPGSEQIETNYSQTFQDMFVLTILDGKRNGTFLEVGGCYPFHNNNTALLEQSFGWSGLSIEYDKKYVDQYRDERPNVKLLHVDALTVNYAKIISETFTGDTVDYLQLDIDPANNTYQCLLKIPFDKYKFRVITYEHDYRIDISKSFREKSRKFLREKGYVLVAGNISPTAVEPFDYPYEDWWVHPDLVEPKILEKMLDPDRDVLKALDYFLE